MIGTPRDLRFAPDQMQEARHGRFGIDHSFVHVDVENVGAALDLLARDRERALEIVGQDQLRKFRRAGDVGPLADDDETEVGRDVERFEPGEMQCGRGLCAPIFGVATIGAQRPLPHWACSRRAIAHRLGNRADVIRRRAAAAADDVEPAVSRPVAQLRRKRFRRLGKTSRRQADRANRRSDKRSCKHGASRASSSTYGSISAGPSAQFNPTTSGSACAMEVRNASTVCPLRVRPERSVIVPEMMSGNFLPNDLESFRESRRSPPWRSACRRSFRRAGDRRRPRSARAPVRA